MKKLKLGMIGCGKFGNKHLGNLLQMEDVEVVALYNRSLGNLEKTGERVPDARRYQDYKQMLTTENLDAVLVCVTPDAHGEIESLCCEKQIHMFCEKPLCLDEKQAMDICEQVKASNIITSVDYQARYCPNLVQVKEVLNKEPIGLVNAFWVGKMPPSLWWRTKAISGGQLVEQATHIADMMRYLLGEAESIYTIGKRNKEFEGLEHDVEDYSSSMIHFKNGALVNLTVGCYTKEYTKIGFEILTPSYKVEYIWNEALTIVTKGKTEIFANKNDNHFTCLETFIQAVKTQDTSKILSTYGDGVKSLKLSLDANQSMKLGIPIFNK